ncbi:hypothetical protein ABT063_41115 [Streptomyces sp. NPDC002838]|uniref:hypothetical protein n=1 Tax=Streptomyces sp. NPDC002838 TaxID=3154436 RepID=UPI0033181DF0
MKSVTPCGETVRTSRPRPPARPRPPRLLECAGALVDSGMRDAGYSYVVVDDCWQAPTRGRDGRLRAGPTRFPDGIAALAEEIHGLGLKFGLTPCPAR